MNHSGDVAEQVMRMSLEGAEVAVKLTGTGALKLAQIIYAILKQQEKTKGKSRLSSMLRSGKALKVFTVREDELKRFSDEAKRYGVLYCVLKDKESPDGNCDVMVRADDASKINRIVQRFKLATVDAASIKTDIQTRQEATAKSIPEREHPEKAEDDKLVDELMSKPSQPNRSENENPSVAKTERSRPSEPLLQKKDNSEKQGVSENRDR
ncbi:MAG: hypothetical protein BGN88_00985, partial [Clostridiales bacterium 43-6]